MTKQTLAYDDEIRTHYPILAGCDEVGRGCLAGPIVTAVVILPPNTDIEDVIDSKKIKKSKHESIAKKIIDTAYEVQIGIRTASEIDASNILEADKDAMRDMINKLELKPDIILIDGDNKQLLGTEYQERTIIKGDAHSLSIGAASIIAKYVRDKLMTEYSHTYPGYGFETNAGYGTPKHKKALAELGITPIHRTTFEPIKSNINNWKRNLGVD